MKVCRKPLLALLLALPVMVQAQVTVPPRPFIHPGVFNSQEELDRIKYRVNYEPSSAARLGWNQMTNSIYAPLSYQYVTYSNVVVVGSGTTNSETQFRRDAHAAYSAALEWVITGNTQYRDKALTILNAWSAAFVMMSPASGTSSAQVELEAAWVAPIWIAAADIIRYHNHGAAGWSSNDIVQFDSMLNYLYTQSAQAATRMNNWGASAALTMIATGVYQDNQARYDAGIQTWRDTMTGINALVDSYNDDSIYEVCRDVTHPQYTLQVWMQAAETAWTQGTNLYSMMIDNTGPPQFSRNLEFFGELFMDLRGTPCGATFDATYSYPGKQSQSGAYDIAYNHYINRQGLTNMPAYADMVTNHWRPGGFDEHFVGWSTLTHGDLSAGIPAVSALILTNTTTGDGGGALADGDIINLRNYTNAGWSIDALTTGTVSWVQFQTNGTAFSITASNAPFTTAGLPPAGDYFITALPSQTMPSGNISGDPFVRFVRVIDLVANLPSISAINNQTIPANASAGPIPFTIGDPAYDVSQLSLGAFSANTNLVPVSGLVLGGSLSNRTLTVTPANNQTGSASITVTVTNPAGGTASSSFTLTVTNTPGWIEDASGDWNDPANWSGGIIATGASMTAMFAIDVTADRYVNNNSVRTLGGLVFSDASPGSAGAWFITNNPITLQVASGAPAVSVSNVTATINSVLNGTQGLALQGNGTIVLGGSNLYSGTTTISSGALRAANNSALGASSGGTTIASAANARLELSGDITLAEPLTIQCKAAASGNVSAVVNVSGTNTLAGGISLTAGGSYWTFEAADGKLRVTGSPTNTTTTNVRTIWLRGAAGGDWLSAIGNSAAALSTAIRKDDSGTWILSGNNTYTGNTVVSNGTLLVNGRIAGGGAVLVYGGTLGGSGNILSPVTISPGAVLSPGLNLGVLTISNTLTLATDSTTLMEINAQMLTNDSVRGPTYVVYAGTLSVTNLTGTLAGGQSFQLFSAAGSTGNFSGISPASPGANLAWSFNPTNGTLAITSLLPPQFTGFALGASGSFTMSGTGPTDTVYRIFATTNLTQPFTNWTPVATGSFSGGVFNFTDPQWTNYPGRFYRLRSP